jgi:hypothetical protein
MLYFLLHHVVEKPTAGSNRSKGAATAQQDLCAHTI